MSQPVTTIEERQARRASTCDRCGGIFSHLTDELAYLGNDSSCQTCGAGSHWERGADKNWLAFNTPPETEYQVFKEQHGRLRVWVFKTRELGWSPLTEGGRFTVGPGEGRPAFTVTAGIPSRRRYRVVANAQDLLSNVGDAKEILDVDGTRISATDLLDERGKVVYDADTVPPLVRTFYVADATMRGQRTFRDALVERREGFRADLEDGHSGGRRKTFGVDRDGSPYERWTENDAWEKEDFLKQEGWFIERAGTTGLPPGRPPEGIHDRLAALEHVSGISTHVRLRITPDGNLETPWLEWKQARARIIEQVPHHVSAETTAEIFGLGKRRVEQIRRFSQNLPKGDRTFSSPAR